QHRWPDPGSVILRSPGERVTSPTLNLAMLLDRTIFVRSISFGFPMPTIYPDSMAYVFWLVLFGFLCIVVFTDLRWILIPNRLFFGVAMVGLIFSIIRGVVLGCYEMPVWILRPGPVFGALDAFLFSFSGFVVGLFLGMPLFALGMAGGGDGKLL